jgi:Manganese containing catalase
MRAADSLSEATAEDSSSRSVVMFIHNKRLQYTVRVGGPDPGLANLLPEQFGGPQGELAAAMRYARKNHL